MLTMLHFTSHKSMINYAEFDGILETPLYLWFLWILNDPIRNLASKKMLIDHRSMLSHREIIWDRLVSNWLIFICTYTSMVYSPSEPVFSTYPITCTIKNLFMTRTICCSVSVYSTMSTLIDGAHVNLHNLSVRSMVNVEQRRSETLD